VSASILIADDDPDILLLLSVYSVRAD